MDHRYWPNARHVHVAWQPCLLCRLDQPTYGDAVGRVHAALDAFVAALGAEVAPPTLPLADALAAFRIALRWARLLAPSSLGDWWPGRFA